MSFILKVEQLVELFNPDNVHRGVSLEKLKKLGKINALEAHLKTNFQVLLERTDKQSIIASETKSILWLQPLHPTITQNTMVTCTTILTYIVKNLEDQLMKVMIAAGFMSLFLGIITEGLKWGWIEGASIFLAVTLVVSLSSIDDYVHEQQFKHLKGHGNNKRTRVCRGSRMYQLDIEELMVGDVIQVFSGDKITVDGVLISGQDLRVDQSQITGEAVQIKKRVPLTYQRSEGADPFIISSSKVISGTGMMLVLAVGRHSYYGNLLLRMNEQHTDSPLKLKIADLSNEINKAGAILSVVTFSSLILHYVYDCFESDNMMQTLFSQQTLHQLVQAILITFTIDVALPRGLPLSVTLALAHTTKQLQKKHIFVKYLNESQTMGGVDNLCLTKTGFITKNLLSVTEIFIEEKVTNILAKEIMSDKTCKILSLAIIMNTQACPKFIHGRKLQVLHVGNKTQSALLEMVYLMGYNYETIRMNPKVKIKRIYSSAHPKRKMGTVYWDEQGKLYLFVKGSPNFLLNYCTSFINKDGLVKSLDFTDVDAINRAIQNFGKFNVHVVMIVYQKISKVPSAWSQVEKNFTLIAIIGVKDALRHNVKETIQQCTKSGIVVRLLSNQSRNKSIAAAKEAGILQSDWVEARNYYTAIEGSDFRELVGLLANTDPTAMASEERKQALSHFRMLITFLKIIYRASAEDKLLLTIGLRQCGHVVAMAGNGSNDTYALRKADISISMACTGNESAKQASDIVFLDDNFESVINTIQWGRHTFNSVRKFLILQLTINLVAAIMALLGAVLLGQSPLNPLQMCWTNVIIDMIGSLALITEEPSEDLTRQKPYSRRQTILTASMIKIITLQSFVQVTILSIILFYGPQLLGIVSSVGVQQWTQQTGKHYSMFFNIFIFLQIFNELNARQLNFQKLNVFRGLIQKYLFLSFMFSSFILQIIFTKFGSKWFHLTELSFKQTLLCLTIGSLSLFFNYFFKCILPKNILIDSKGIQFGRFKYKWFSKDIQETKSQNQVLQKSRQTESQIALRELSQYLQQQRLISRAFSYLQQKDSLRITTAFFRQQYNSGQDQNSASQSRQG